VNSFLEFCEMEQKNIDYENQRSSDVVRFLFICFVLFILFYYFILIVLFFLKLLAKLVTVWPDKLASDPRAGQNLSRG
jgi:hypothetical protein